MKKLGTRKSINDRHFINKIMKQGWEIKKLGEVCTVERGGSPRPIDAFLTDAEDGINWIKIGDATTGSKYITATKEKIKPEGVKKSRMVYKDDFILSNSMSFGKPYILGIDGCIHDGWLVLRDSNNLFDKSFLYYYLGSPNIYREFKRLAVGGVVNNLNSELVRGVNVVIPPLIEQEKIVAELDCLSGIIEKKKQQLKEYDALAQSIFYEMFGNPIDNEKGWARERLGNIGEIIAGSTPSTTDETNWGGDVNWVTPAELDVQLYYGETIRKITEKASKSLILMPIGTVLLSSRAPIGKIAITTVPMCCNQGFKNIICGNRVNNIFLYYYLMLTMDDIQALGRGATFKEVSKKSICDYKIFVPPVSLQQEFVSKIEAIEKQKELIKQSIAETETLFNSRMDYYFN